MNSCLRSRVRAALLCSTVLLAPLAMADTTPAPAPTAANPAPAAAPKQDDTLARHRADREAFFNARLAALHAGLQLKPDQDALWSPVETAIRGFAKLRAGHDAEKTPEPGSVDGLRAQADRLIAMGTAMKNLADASGPFTASLSADQKGRLPTLLDDMRPKRVLARAFGIERHDEEHDAWSGEGMRHEHWGHHHWRGEEERDRHADRSEHEGSDRWEHRHHEHGWDRDHEWGRERMGRSDEPRYHHHDEGDREDERT